MGSSYSNVTMVTRASDMIDFIGEDYSGKSAAELIRKFSLPKTTCYRLLQTLVKCEFLTQDVSTGLYYLGKKFSDYATIEEHKLHLLQAVSRPYLKDLSLQAQETAKISVLSSMSCYVLDNAEGPQNIKISVKTGSVFPLHAGASSKILFLSMGNHAQSILFNKGLERYTSKTITSQSEMLVEFEKIAKQGYSVDNGEYIEGICAVACPVYDYSGKIIAAVSIVYAASSMNQATIESLVPHLKETTQNIGYDFQKQRRQHVQMN